MTQTPLVVGVFQDERQAKNAIDQLRAAGFGYDQVGVAMREGGAVTKNLLDDLTKLGVPQDRAGYYDNEFRSGRTVVSVRPDGRDQEAMSILRNNGAYDYNQGATSTQNADYAQTNTASTYGQTGYTQANTADTYNQADYAQAGNYAQGTTADAQYANETDEQRRLRLREEQLNVGKERVQTGEVGLHKEVVEEQRTVDVPVTREEVVLEHRPVTGGQVDNTPIGQDESIRVPVSEEQVEVTKTPVVTGEVSIGKRPVQENQQVTDTVRREEARLDQAGNSVVQGDTTFNNADRVDTNDTTRDRGNY